MITFTQKARDFADPYWTGSFEHPFILELAKGTLAPEIFRYYLLQDRYYLEHFSRLYQLIGDASEDIEVKELMLLNSRHLAEGELAIREGFFKELGITEAEIAATPVAPTAYNYVSHMYRQLIQGTANTAFAGMLPCPWLYQEIGERLIAAGSPNPLYQRWIATYAGEEGRTAVANERRILDRLYDAATPAEQKQMLEAFCISSQMEFAFWEMAMTLESWPLEAVTVSDRKS